MRGPIAPHQYIQSVRPKRKKEEHKTTKQASSPKILYLLCIFCFDTWGNSVFSPLYSVQYRILDKLRKRLKRKKKMIMPNY